MKNGVQLSDNMDINVDRVWVWVCVLFALLFHALRYICT